MSGELRRNETSSIARVPAEFQAMIRAVTACAGAAMPAIPSGVPVAERGTQAVDRLFPPASRKSTMMPPSAPTAFASKDRS